ncbi:uncharacterized protein JN550_012597, partial [Neoarthrinium moseri]|uniref:uncharacterized protein n=1 Tax=Neoarthrinium moseri TaxID=1658444 RepID=UPI001FDC5AC1
MTGQVANRSIRRSLGILKRATTEGHMPGLARWRTVRSGRILWFNERDEEKTSKKKEKRSDGDILSKQESMRDSASREYIFANTSKLSVEALEDQLFRSRQLPIPPHFFSGLRRGVSVHHAGMNRQYWQVVEMLYRKGFLTVVIATGTISLGLNMSCKTVVFTGDSIFLSALNYRQASRRAGRRDFDLQENVVFHNIPAQRAAEIISAKLLDLRGQFPISTTLILRLFTLLRGTENSDYATNAVKSLLTQAQLFLGGPHAQMTINPHLRFLIDSLRQNELLSSEGAPLNFAGLVGHLYFTEDAAFAFHALLKAGYFHELCAEIWSRRSAVLLELMLVLSHLFCRIPCLKPRNDVKCSPSIVILPNLSKKAYHFLKTHNRDTLETFRAYVATYAHQYLQDSLDTQLPFSKRTVKPCIQCPDVADLLPSLQATAVKSPFSALFGFTDNFQSIGELCNSVRSGVFLEDPAIPYIRIVPDETGGVPWNAYLYDFYKHGDLTALVRDNGIKRGDVWFRLKDFFVILATITTSLGNFLDPKAKVDSVVMADIQDAS